MYNYLTHYIMVHLTNSGKRNIPADKKGKCMQGWWDDQQASSLYSV